MNKPNTITILISSNINNNINSNIRMGTNIHTPVIHKLVVGPIRLEA